MLSAARMLHYPGRRHHRAASRRACCRREPDEPRLTVRAERGQLSRDGDEIFLYDNVLLVREADAEHARGAHDHRASCTSCAMRSLVRTDREVKIVEDTPLAQGRGMEYNNESRELILHAHDVRAALRAEARMRRAMSCRRAVAARRSRRRAPRRPTATSRRRSRRTA